VLYRLARRHELDGRYADELALREELISVAERGGSERPVCEAYYLHGSCLMRLGRRREARPDYERSAALARDEGEPYYESAATMLLGVIDLETRNPGARSRFEEARRIAEAGGRDELAAWAEMFVGFALLRQGELAAAKERLDVSLSMAETTDLRFRILVHLAEADRRSGKLDQAEQRYEEILQLADEVDVKEDLQDAWTGLALLHRERGRRDEAIAAARRSEGMIEELRDAIPVLAERSYLLERRSDAYQVLAASLAQRDPDDLGESFDVLERAHARTLRETLRESANARLQTTTLDLEQVRARLAPGDLLLEFLFGEEESSLIVIDADGIAHETLPARREIDDLVQRYRQALLRPLASVDARVDPHGDYARFEDEIRSLRRALLGPVEARVREAERLIVVPDRRLYLVPLEALPEEDGSFLGQSRAVIYLPAASMLSLAPERAHASDRIVVLNADEAQVPSGLAPLRFADEEARRVAASYAPDHVTLLSGADASLERLVEVSRQPVDVLHLTSHAVLDPEVGPRVLLAGSTSETQSALDVASLNRLATGPRLAVLSACETGRGELVGGEGVLGLVRALTLRGTPQVVASLWTVDDELSATMMGMFHAALASGLPPSRALLEARRSLLSEGFVHPFYWSGFVLYGADPASSQ
jgi:tetratricopeptide (TPR) repeat protein